MIDLCETTSEPETCSCVPAVEIDCQHWLWPSSAVVYSVDVPHWLIDREGENA